MGLRPLSGIRNFKFVAGRIASSQILMRFGAFMQERFPKILQERYCGGSASFFCRNEFQKIPFGIDAEVSFARKLNVCNVCSAEKFGTQTAD